MPASYWDTESSSRASSFAGTGQTTSKLQSETSYNDIYASWNVDVDGSPGNDDPWTFGAADQYPVLKYAGMDTTAQFAMQPPGIPTSVTVTVQADTLDVRWTAASYATGYKVQWKAGMQSYDASRQATVADTLHQIPNLIGGMTYTVRVIATKTGASDGRPSAEQTGVPLLGSPTGVEVNAKVDTLTVTWNAVNGATGYKVQWKSGSETYPAADEESATHGQATIAGGSTTIHKISGLTPGTTYAIRVIATRTNVADSAPSEEVITLLTLGSPTGVEVSAKVDTLTVTWNAVPLATGYKVQWKSGGTDLSHLRSGVGHARASHHRWREHHDPQNFWADRRDDLRDSRHRHAHHNGRQQCPFGRSHGDLGDNQTHQCARDIGAGPTHCGLDRGNRCDGIQGAVEVPGNKPTTPLLARRRSLEAAPRPIR